MGGYLASFSVYTFAMIGFLFFAVAIYKKTSAGLTNSKNGGMEIEESLSLSPRKRLCVVRVNDEKFLIAADTERTEFLAKLDNNENTDVNSNLVHLNKTPKLISGHEDKITEISKKLRQKQNQSAIQGNVALKTVPQTYTQTRLSKVKNINMKKPPMMRAILNKLEG